MGSPHTSTANFYAWKIQNTDMNSASSLANKSVDIQKNWSTFKLLIAPESSGIKTVSLTAVQLIFDNSRFLSQKNGLVVPKPHVTYGSFLCANSANNLYIDMPRKVNAFKSDRTCININLKICEDALADSELIGLLPEMVYQKRHHIAQKYKV